jgi:UDP-N-acetylglucosamine 2-epimerase
MASSKGGAMMKKICCITTCRADYGYLYYIMEDLQDSYNIVLQIICPTSHQNFQEINDKFGRSLCRANPICSIDDFGRFYKDCLDCLRVLKSDMVVILGDRFEMLAAATAVLLLNIPIAHIHGGETTTGAFDDNIRNAITMMADYHFTATEEYAQNVSHMTRIDEYKDCITNEYCWNMNEDGFGYERFNTQDEETKKRIKIFNVGSPGLDWLTRTKLLSRQELQQHVSIDLNQPFIVACFHPVTKELEHTTEYTINMLRALHKSGMQFIVIMPNFDPKNNEIRNAYLCYDDDHPNNNKVAFIDNLDHLTYLSLLQFASFMVGNSSSGIIESASFNLPSVTVGTRQEGRIKPDNVFSCPCETEAILTAIDRAREWNALVGKCENLYGDGNSSKRIVEILEEI